MYTTSFQGMYPTIPTNVRSSSINSQFWPYANMFQGHYGYHPYSYPYYGNVDYFQPSGNPSYKHPYNYQHELHHGMTHHNQQVKAKQSTKNQHHKMQSPIKHHEYHWHHGYPYGQGSGLFPDNYHSNY